MVNNELKKDSHAVGFQRHGSPCVVPVIKKYRGLYVVCQVRFYSDTICMPEMSLSIAMEKLV